MRTKGLFCFHYVREEMVKRGLNTTTPAVDYVIYPFLYTMLGTSCLYYMRLGLEGCRGVATYLVASCQPQQAITMSVMSWLGSSSSCLRKVQVGILSALNVYGTYPGNTRKRSVVFAVAVVEKQRVVQRLAPSWCHVAGCRAAGSFNVNPCGTQAQQWSFCNAG